MHTWQYTLWDEEDEKGGTTSAAAPLSVPVTPVPVPVTPAADEIFNVAVVGTAGNVGTEWQGQW